MNVVCSVDFDAAVPDFLNIALETAGLLFDFLFVVVIVLFGFVAVSLVIVVFVAVVIESVIEVSCSKLVATHPCLLGVDFVKVVDQVVSVVKQVVVVLLVVKFAVVSVFLFVDFRVE